MTDDHTTDDGVAPADAINGFGDLYPRQMSHSTWNVLSFRQEEPTAYQVSTADMDCPCQDMAMNKEDSEICDHLAVALYQSSRTIDLEQTILRDLRTEFHNIERATEALEDAAETAEGVLVSSRDAEAETAAQDDSGGTEQSGPAKVETWLQSEGIPMSDVNVWEHEEYGSINFEADGLSDADFDTFRDLCQSSDFVSWDQNNRQNYIPADQLGEVPA